MDMLQEYFLFAFNRHVIYLKRKAGLPKGQWTDDPIFKKYKICNVYRELDKTTVWFRENVRERLRSDPWVIPATFTFRWFNRISVGQVIFNSFAWDSYTDTLDIDILREMILRTHGEGPYLSPAYMTRVDDGSNALDSALNSIDNFVKEDTWRKVADYCLNNPITLKEVWEYLRNYPLIGNFVAYEMVTDLRHTDFLCNALDIMIWANIGPGSGSGLNRIFGRPLKMKVSVDQALFEMSHILRCSQDPNYWPQDNPDFPPWEMRDVEHVLCDFDKYIRIRNGQGKLRIYKSEERSQYSV